MASIISIKKLRKEYPQPSTPLVVLDDLDFSIEAGQMAAIIGHSGCGKSTFLNILGLLDVPTSSVQLEIAGTDIGSLSLEERTHFRGKNIGFIFQFHQLLPEFTALQNVILPMQVHEYNPKKFKEKAMQLMEMVFTPEEMNNRVYERKPSQLSGGQCQRVAIARSMANDPSIILADEPTGSLDPDSASRVLEILQSLPAQNKTIIMITHQLEIARRADVIYQMSERRLKRKMHTDFSV